MPGHRGLNSYNGIHRRRINYRGFRTGVVLVGMTTAAIGLTWITYKVSVKESINQAYTDAGIPTPQ